jgi:hypothetical protein
MSIAERVPTRAACKLLDLKRAECAGSELSCPYAGNAAPRCPLPAGIANSELSFSGRPEMCWTRVAKPFCLRRVRDSHHVDVTSELRVWSSLIV